VNEEILRSTAQDGTRSYGIIDIMHQWFLTGGRATPGGVNKFPGWREPLRALPYGKFDQ